jgi:hypothetical protein
MASAVFRIELWQNLMKSLDNLSNPVGSFSYWQRTLILPPLTSHWCQLAAATKPTLSPQRHQHHSHVTLTLISTTSIAFNPQSSSHHDLQSPAYPPIVHPPPLKPLHKLRQATRSRKKATTLNIVGVLVHARTSRFLSFQVWGDFYSRTYISYRQTFMQHLIMIDKDDTLGIGRLNGVDVRPDVCNCLRPPRFKNRTRRVNNSGWWIEV